MADYTKTENDMARAGYVYSRTASRNGLRDTVKHLAGRDRADLIFDCEAYQADHIGHGIEQER